MAETREVWSRGTSSQERGCNGTTPRAGYGCLPGVGYSWCYLTHPRKTPTAESLVKGPTAAEWSEAPEIKCSHSSQLPWWLRRESICLQRRRPGFNPRGGKIPWGRKGLPTPVFLPGESHGRRSLVGYSTQGPRESDTT